jgi:hypothetical protein
MTLAHASTVTTAAATATAEAGMNGSINNGTPLRKRAQLRHHKALKAETIVLGVD